MRAFERCGLEVIVMAVCFAVCSVYSESVSRNTVSRPLLPEGDNGIAAKYPGDAGIENDPDVIFVEDFEGGSITDMEARWETVKNMDIMSLSTDVPGGSAGQHSLLMTHVGGSSTGGYLYRRLFPGYEKLHLRFYVKFDPDCNGIHHFVHLGGYNPSSPWPQGEAGIRPVGNERFTTGVEPFGSRWRWDFYTYWMEMRACSTGDFWGNDFINDENVVAERDKWICVELMMKMNNPVSERNGEQAIWIDGHLWKKDGQIISHLGKGFPKGNWVTDSFIPDPDGDPFEGFRWRSDQDLKLNFVWVLLYITTAPAGYESKVWFDNIVVAKEYIGPMTSTPRLSIKDIRSSGEGLIGLTWGELGAGFVYTVQYRQSLTEGNWAVVPPADQWPTSSTDWTDILASMPASRFYRIVAETALEQFPFLELRTSPLLKSPGYSSVQHLVTARVEAFGENAGAPANGGANPRLGRVRIAPGTQ